MKFYDYPYGGCCTDKCGQTDGQTQRSWQALFATCANAPLICLSYGKAIRNSRTKPDSNGRGEISWIINKIQLRGLLSPGMWRRVVSLLRAEISSTTAIFMLRATSTTLINLICCNLYQEKFVEWLWATVLVQRRFCWESRSQFDSRFKRWHRKTRVSSEPATPV